MNTLLKLAMAFLLGVVVMGLGMWYGLVAPAGKGAALIYATGVEEQAHVALLLRQGQQEKLLKDIDASLPQLVQALEMIGGKSDFTIRAMQRVRNYYDETGVPIPAEIKFQLASLPALAPKSHYRPAK